MVQPKSNIRTAKDAKDAKGININVNLPAGSHGLDAITSMIRRRVRLRTDCRMVRKRTLQLRTPRKSMRG